MFPCLHVLIARLLVDFLLPATDLNASQTFMKLGVQYGYTRLLGYVYESGHPISQASGVPRFTQVKNCIE